MSQQLLINHFSAVDPEAHISTVKNASGNYQYKVFDDIDDSIEIIDDDKYGIYSRPHHINFFTFWKFVEMLDTIKEPVIVETGTSATLVNSSHFFDKYISMNGGTFDTVDINPGAGHMFRRSVQSSNTKIHTGDSVKFLKEWDGPKIDAAYLDSYDLEYLNPIDSANHGKNEMEALLPHLKDNSFVLIDDTPKNPMYLPWRNETAQQVGMMYQITQMMPGKGMLVEDVLKKSNFNYEVVIHQHQVLYKLTKKN